MEAVLSAYGSDDDMADFASTVPPIHSTAPVVTSSTSRHASSEQEGSGLDPSSRVVYHNPRASRLFSAVHGAAAPRADGEGFLDRRRNHRSGHVEVDYTSTAAFETQYESFMSKGFASRPGGVGVAVDRGPAAPQHEDTIDTTKAKSKKTRQRSMETADDEGEDGGWGNAIAAAYAARQNTSAWTEVREDRLEKPARTKDAMEYHEWQESRRSEKKKKKMLAENAGPFREGDVEPAHITEEEANAGDVEKTYFHGKEEKDYAGNSWTKPPKDKKSKINLLESNCYIPKKWEYTWPGHGRGVSAVRFFPGYGHLMLSAGLDSKLKIWDVYGSGKCMRTYLGHTQAVKDVQFSNDGSRFLSAGFDRMIKLWDTETGKVIGRFTTGKVPNCVRFHPDDDKQNVMLAGMSDKKIVQFDMDSGNLEQEYNEHLGAVNSITFVDENRRFVTSSDDKSLRVWDFGTPVQIKYIADPSMHSMPSVTVHPNGGWIACQSLDNQIVVYSTRERFKKNPKKVFKGHTNSGYACQVSFSPDGKFIMSGDANGRMFFWDWKTSRVFRTFKAHDGVCIGCVWHPLEQSKVATCGWDGLIKYWD